MSVFVCYGISATICKHQGNQFLPYEGFFMPNLYLQNYRIDNSITSCKSDGGVSGRVFLQPAKQACFMVTAKPLSIRKKLSILGDGLAKQSEPQQCKFKSESL